VSEYDPGELAYVYIATPRGAGRVLYQTTVKDAMRICKLEETQGKFYGIPWAYHWTSKKNFEAHNGALNQKNHLQKDDGRFAKLFSRLGIKATPINEVKTVKTLPVKEARFKQSELFDGVA
jgi:hypothetical protein